MGVVYRDAVRSMDEGEKTMFRSRMLRQFFCWYVVLIAVPALVLAASAYQNVRSYARSEMQSSLSFDLERAAASADRILEDAQRNMQALIASQDIHKVLLSMCADARNGQMSFARYAGEYELRPLLEPLLFQDTSMADVLFFSGEGCLFSYSHYVPPDATLSGYGISGNMHWLGEVEDPFGIKGTYLMLLDTIRDFTSSAQETLCTVVVLIEQEGMISILDDNARYDDNISALLGPGGVLVVSSAAAGSRDLIDQAAARENAISKDILVLHSGDRTVPLDACSVHSTVEGLRYIQLSPADHTAAYSMPVLTLVFSWAMLSILTLVLFALLVSRQIIRPTVRLAGIMTSLTASDLDVRLPSPGVHNELEDVYDGFSSMLSRLKDSFERIRISEKQKRHYQLGMLKYQINPHFLYNTLNSIRFSCLKNGDQASADMLVTLSRLLRNTLNNPTEMIALSAEVSNLRDYVSLQQIRYEHHLDFHIACAAWESLGNAQVPMMILQPIVENAISHGLSAALNAGTYASITLTIRTEGHVLLLTVKDNGEGIGEMELRDILNEKKREPLSSQHIGLANIHRRLHLMFGEAYGVSIESQVGEYTCVTLRLPLLPGTAENKEGNDDVASHSGGR